MKDNPGTELQTVDYVLSPALGAEEAKRQIEQVQQFVDDLLVKGEDYGVIPGTQKPTLLKPGAEKLCNLFALASHFSEVRHIENWEKGLFYYVYDCQLVNKKTGQVETNCTGSANSKEERYRYRYEQRTCPTCSEATVIKGKEKWGGGWICWKKNGGCGAKFKDGDAAIEGQAIGKVENTEPFTLVNTLKKMAQKRALVGATLTATGLSRRFTQDIEDLPIEQLNDEPTPKAKGKARGKKSEDPMTQFWSCANNHAIEKKTAQAFLDEAGGDPEKALAEMRERLALDEEIPF